MAFYAGYRHLLTARVNSALAPLRAAGYPVTVEELDAWYPMPAGPNVADVYARAFAGSTTLDFRSTSTWCNTSGLADFSLTADVVGGSDNIWVYMTDENGTHLKEQTCYRSSGVCIDGLH